MVCGIEFTDLEFFVQTESTTIQYFDCKCRKEGRNIMKADCALMDKVLPEVLQEQENDNDMTFKDQVASVILVHCQN